MIWGVLEGHGGDGLGASRSQSDLIDDMGCSGRPWRRWAWSVALSISLGDHRAFWQLTSLFPMSCNSIQLMTSAHSCLLNTFTDIEKTPVHSRQHQSTPCAQSLFEMNYDRICFRNYRIKIHTTLMVFQVYISDR